MAHPLDLWLAPLFGLTASMPANGAIGTFLLAGIVVLLGELTLRIVARVNRDHLARLEAELKNYQELTREAERRGDAASYKALNRQANSAFGHVFFNKFGLSAAALWPCFFALDWLQARFDPGGVPLPGKPEGVNYVLVFLAAYILARILAGRLRRAAPRRIARRRARDGVAAA
ncbi:MAG: hypothetical protein WHT06_08345 [Desulfobacterales bacterium]